MNLICTTVSRLFTMKKFMWVILTVSVWDLLVCRKELKGKPPLPPAVL